MTARLGLKIFKESDLRACLASWSGSTRRTRISPQQPASLHLGRDRERQDSSNQGHPARPLAHAARSDPRFQGRLFQGGLRNHRRFTVHDASFGGLPFNPMVPPIDPETGRVNPMAHVHELAEMMARIKSATADFSCARPSG